MAKTLDSDTRARLEQPIEQVVRHVQSAHHALLVESWQVPDPSDPNFGNLVQEHLAEERAALAQAKYYIEAARQNLAIARNIWPGGKKVLDGIQTLLDGLVRFVTNNEEANEAASSMDFGDSERASKVLRLYTGSNKKVGVVLDLHRQSAFESLSQATGFHIISDNEGIRIVS